MAMSNLAGSLMTSSSDSLVRNSLILLSVTTIVLVVARSLQRPALPRGAFADKGWPVLGSPRFFYQRDTFLKEGLAKSPNGHFSFYYGRYPIVAVTGQNARDALFTTRGLDLVAAVRFLFVPGPDFNKLLGRDMSHHWKTVFRNKTNKADLKRSIPSLVGDADALFRGLDTSLTLKPFRDFFPLIYTMMHRSIGCLDLCKDPMETLVPFGIICTATATGVMFPKLPTPTSIVKVWFMIRMYRRLSRIVSERRRTGNREDDAIQFMMDNGDSVVVMFLNLIGSILVGLANTTIQTAWLQCLLAADPHWYAETRAEVNGVVAKYRESDDQSPAEVLSRLSPEEWENEFPIIHAGLTDGIRMMLPGPSVRKNISGRDIPIGNTGVILPPDAFVLYTFQEIHFDPNIYPDPFRWDPSRYLNGKQPGDNAPHGYLGWGSGLHPCVGMKLAKLFATITTAMLVSHFDFHLCDEKGNPRTEPLPLPARDGLEGSALVEGVYLKCERRS